MKKSSILVSLLLFLLGSSYAQVAINKDGSQPNANSILHIKGDASAKNIVLEPGTNGNVGISTINPKVKLHISGGTDASFSNGSGYLLIGTESSRNIVMDNNEIIARNNGFSSTLFIQGSGSTASTVLNPGGGNVGIGTINPAASAALDISSNNKGLLPPRVTNTSAISNPIAGLMVYDQSNNSLRLHNGNNWTSLAVTGSSGTPGSGFNCGDYFIDPRDNQEYNTVLIGNQCWMRENLNIGTMINGSNQTNNGTIEKYCYNNDASNCDTYGGLYQWNEMMQYVTTEGVQGICPDGWHIPTDTEWKILEGELGMSTSDADNTEWRGNTQGNMICGNGYLWNDGNMDSNTDFAKSGFTGLPGGYRNTTGLFYNLTYSAIFWSSSEGGTNAWSRHLHYSHTEVFRYNDNKAIGFSVRCVRD